MKKSDSRLCLVTGATGYIGGRLIPRLLESGWRVRIMTRDISRVKGRSWFEEVEVVEADVLKPETLPDALRGVRTAYYLIHSMSGEDEFYSRDVMAARNFGSAAKKQGVKHIIYLGGLGDPEDDLSEHLASRQQTGKVLREPGVPVTEFRAAIVVGSGSISFEMIRYLTERIPIMICPSWVRSRVQPIAIHDVLQYLVGALDNQNVHDSIIEIGGSSVLTYSDMMRIYADEKGLKRFLISVPVLTPNLSSYWVHWMTPVPASIAKPLIQGLKNDVVVRNDRAINMFPDIDPLSYRQAVQLAIDRVNTDEVETTWTDALIRSRGDEKPLVLTTEQGMIIEKRTKEVKADPGIVFDVYTGLGGDNGWLTFNWAWKFRGIIDRLAGGVGFRRGRRHPTALRPGEVLDFWRVEHIESNRQLRLRAEMKLPGMAWLEFRSEPVSDGASTRLIQTAFFDPRGLPGLLYWYLLYPMHALIFSSLIEQIARESEKRSRQFV